MNRLAHLDTESLSGPVLISQGTIVTPILISLLGTGTIAQLVITQLTLLRVAGRIYIFRTGLSVQS